MQFDDERITVRRGAPGIGEHTDEVLTEAGFTADEIAALREAGPPAPRSDPRRSERHVPGWRGGTDRRPTTA